jgi:mRNA interferase YafQ
MKKVSQTRQFSRDVKRMRKRGKDLDKLREVVRLLAEGTLLPANYRDHPLIGPWRPSRDCHIEADWILVYTADGDSLRLERTGTHSDLFKK